MRNFFLVRNRLELHYLRLLVLSLILPTLLIGGCLYHLIFYLLAEQIGIPEAVVEQLSPVVQKVNIFLMVSIPILFLILISIGIFLSRRLAGPIERLEKELDGIVTGNLVSRRLQLRKGDELKPMVDSVNTLLDKIEKR
jgi:signal transduction histidine kinase